MDDKNLKTLLKKLPLEKPAADFTSFVMEEIKAGVEAAPSLAVKSRLSGATIEAPSNGFTANVTRQLNKQHLRTAYGPIIERKVWVAVGVVLVICTLKTLTTTSSSATQHGFTTKLIELGALLSKTITSYAAFTIYFPIITATLLLMLLDYAMRQVNSQN